MYNRRYSKLVVFLAAVKSIKRENDESEEIFKAICYRNSEKNEKEKPLFTDSSCVIYQLKQRHRMEKTLQNRVKIESIVEAKRWKLINQASLRRFYSHSIVAGGLSVIS